MYGNSVFRLGRLSSKINHYVNANIPKFIWFGLLPHRGQEGFAEKTVVHVIRLGKYAEDCSAFLICLLSLFNWTQRAAKLRGTDWGLKLPFGVKCQAIAQQMRGALSKILSLPEIKQLEVMP